MTPSDRRRSGTASVLVRIAFGVLALMSLGLGLGIYLLAAHLGVDESTARLIATAFLIAGILDAAVVHFWDRLFSGDH